MSDSLQGDRRELSRRNLLKASGVVCGVAAGTPLVAADSKESDNAAICLAVLRRDGFVSLEAGMYTALGGPDSGAILTRPFPVPGGKLLVNLEAPQGGLLTEVLDKNGQVLARSVLLQGDHPQSEVEWEKGEMEKLTGKVVSLRFTLRDGHFYSYWFE